MPSTSSVIIAIGAYAAAVGTVANGFVTVIFTGRREKANWLRDARLNASVRLIEAANDYIEACGVDDDEDREAAVSLVQSNVSAASATIALLGPKKLADAAEAYLNALEELAEDTTEEVTEEVTDESVDVSLDIRVRFLAVATKVLNDT